MQDILTLVDQADGGTGFYRRNSRLKRRLYGHSRRPQSKQNVIVKPISNHTVE